MLKNEKIEAKILNEIRISKKNVLLEELKELFPLNQYKIKQILDKLSYKGLIEEIEDKNGKISYIIRNTRKPLNKKSLVIKKIKKEINKLKKVISSFFPHIISFVSVMTGLIIINLISSPSYFWFLWALGGWSIGVFIHFVLVITALKHKNKLQNLSYEITLEQFKIFQKILKNEQNLYSHSASYLIVNTFLFCIYWFAAHTANPWIIYPIIGWGIGMAIHLVTFFQTLNRLKNRLKTTGFNFENLKKKKMNNNANYNNMNKMEKIISDINDNYKSIINEAVKIKESIMANINSNKKIKNKIDDGIEEIIDKHINKIKDLSLRDKKIAAAVSSISIDEINNQIKMLQEKLNTTNNNNLKKEYNKTIDKYKKQIKTYNDLKEKKEIFYLRISNSLINLKQLNLDILSMKELLHDEDSYSYDILEEKTYDLSNHVKNLKDSYSTLDRELE